MVDFENDIKNCVDALQKGDVILYPTETVWGLGCDALNEDAVGIDVARIVGDAAGEQLVGLFGQVGRARVFNKRHGRSLRSTILTYATFTTSDQITW